MKDSKIRQSQSPYRIVMIPKKGESKQHFIARARKRDPNFNFEDWLKRDAPRLLNNFSQVKDLMGGL